MSTEPFFRFSTQSVFKAPSKLFSRIHNQKWIKKKNSKPDIDGIPGFSDPIPVELSPEILKLLKPLGFDEAIPGDRVHSETKSDSVLDTDNTEKTVDKEDSDDKSIVGRQPPANTGDGNTEKESPKDLGLSEPLNPTLRNSLAASLSNSGIDLWIILDGEIGHLPSLSPKPSTVTRGSVILPSKNGSSPNIPSTISGRGKVSQEVCETPKSSIISKTKSEHTTRQNSSSVSSTSPPPKNSNSPSPKQGPVLSPNEPVMASPELQNSVNAFWSLHKVLEPLKSDEPTTHSIPSSRGFSLEIGKKTHTGRQPEHRDSGNTFVFNETSLVELDGNSNKATSDAQKKRDELLAKLRFDGGNDTHTTTTEKRDIIPKIVDTSPEHMDTDTSKSNIPENSKSARDTNRSNGTQTVELPSTTIGSSESTEKQKREVADLSVARPTKLNMQNISRRNSENGTQTPVTTPRNESNARHVWREIADEKLALSIKKEPGEEPRILEAVLRPNPLRNTGSIRDIAGFQSPTSPRGPGYQPGYISGGTTKTPANSDRESSHVSTISRKPQRRSTAQTSSHKGHGSLQPKIKKSEKFNRPLPDTPFVKEEGLVANLGGAKHEAVFAHRRQLSDEIDIDPGDILKVFEVFEDGWCLARISEPKNMTEGRNRIGACPRCCLRVLN